MKLNYYCGATALQDIKLSQEKFLFMTYSDMIDISFVFDLFFPPPRSPHSDDFVVAMRILELDLFKAFCNSCLSQ